MDIAYVAGAHPCEHNGRGTLPLGVTAGVLHMPCVDQGRDAC